MTASVHGPGRRLVLPRGPAIGRPSRPTSGMARDPRIATATPERRGPQRERHEMDHLLLVATIALVAIGLLMIYSSVGVEAAVQNGGDPFTAALPQLGWSALGLLAMTFFYRLDYRYLRLASIPAYLIALALLAVVLLPAIGPFRPIESGGSTRWLEIGPLPQMHPAELTKLALVIYLAHWLARRGAQVSGFFSGTLPFLLICGPAIALVALEPDLGTTAVLALAACAMFIVAGGSVLRSLLLIPIGVAAAAAYVQANPYQLDRVKVFLDPWSSPPDMAFQTVQGLLALGRGGIFGIGLGESSRPGGLALPNAHNDFIFALIGQELGLIGASLVIGLYLLFAYRGIRIALAAPDTFGGLLAAGVTAWLTFQALINICVVLVLMPITGIPLPFVSDGGSSLVVSFAAVGILLSISRETLPRGTWNDADPHRGRGYGRPHLPGPGSTSLALRARR